MFLFARLRWAAILLAALSLAPACKPRESKTVDAAEVARQEANRRLEGSWVLVSFQPRDALEPMLQALLAVQMGRLVVTFDGSNMRAVGTGVDTTRRYQVTEAYANRLTLRSFDDRNVAYDAVGEMRGDELWFEARTSPWHGRGLLRRLR